MRDQESNWRGTTPIPLARFSEKFGIDFRNVESLVQTKRGCVPRLVKTRPPLPEKAGGAVESPGARVAHRDVVTTNVVASPFAAVRLRTSAAKRFNKVGRGTAIIWRLLRIAVKRFRKLNAPEQCRDVYSGVRYVDGAEVPAVPSTQMAAAERTFTHFLKRPPDCGKGAG
jgi:hypothetical protein